MAQRMGCRDPRRCYTAAITFAPLNPRPCGGGLPMQQVTVRVPASTSNLGPGYDCLGVALRLYNRVSIARGKLTGASHPAIVADAAERFFNQARRGAFLFSCSIMERIPRCRGLGSSATVRLGVLLGLNRLSGDPLDRLTLFRLCAELEGHPDNAAPASFGGFTVVQSNASTSIAHGKRSAAIVQRFDVGSRLFFVVLVPELEIETARARSILPSKISRVAAVENCANASAITAAFASRDYEKMRGTFSDNLHQPFRAKLIQFLPRVIAAAERAGALGAYLSGSGSAVAAVTLDAPKKVAAAMVRTASVPARTIITHADNRGAQISSTDH
ncbi:MAG: homoserine kinase [Nitrospirota bacterium]